MIVDYHKIVSLFINCQPNNVMSLVSQLLDILFIFYFMVLANLILLDGLWAVC